MKLKVFKLKNGKLEFLGIREVQSGDIIVEGETSMAETVHLRESRLDDVHSEILGKLNEEQKEAFKSSLRSMGMPDPETRAALEVSIRRLHPEYSDEQVQTFVKGR